jgi:hypothetical protein
VKETPSEHGGAKRFSPPHERQPDAKRAAPEKERLKEGHTHTVQMTSEKKDERGEHTKNLQVQDRRGKWKLNKPAVQVTKVNNRKTESNTAYRDVREGPLDVPKHEIITRKQSQQVTNRATPISSSDTKGMQALVVQGKPRNRTRIRTRAWYRASSTEHGCGNISTR